MGSIQWNRGKTCEVFLNRGSNGRVMLFLEIFSFFRNHLIGPSGTVRCATCHLLKWKRWSVTTGAQLKRKGKLVPSEGGKIRRFWKRPRSKYTQNQWFFFGVFVGVYSDGVPPKCSWQSLSLVKGRGSKSLTWLRKRGLSDEAGVKSFRRMKCVKCLIRKYERKSSSLEIYCQALSLCWTKTVSSIFWLFYVEMISGCSTCCTHFLTIWGWDFRDFQHRACVYSLAVFTAVSIVKKLWLS